MGKVVKRILWSTLALVLIVCGAVYLVASTSLFLGVRQNLAEGVLANLLQRPVTINGDVRLTFSGDVVVVVEDVVFPPQATRPSLLKDEAIERVEFHAPIATLIGTGSDISRFHFTGARIDFGDLASTDEQPSADAETMVLGFYLDRFLRNPISRDLQISDVVLAYRNTRDGWDEQLTIDVIRSTGDADRKTIDIAVEGKVNDTPLKMAARIDDPLLRASARDLDFTLEMETTGLAGQAVGVVDISRARPTIRGPGSTCNPRPLGDLLDMLQIERAIEGDLRLQARLEGPFESLRMHDMEAVAESSGGNRLAVTGGIADLGSGDGMALDFRVDLAPDPTVQDVSNALLDLEITGYRGRLAGDVDTISLQDFFIDTNVANVELMEIGPISIGRIVKDEADRIGLLDIRILDGDPERPSLDLEGDIKNLLQLSETRFSGTFDVPLDWLFEVDSDPADPRFGRLVGTIVLSDVDGTFGLDEFDGRLQDTDLLELEFDMGIGVFRRLDEIELETSFRIPNLKAFGAAAGIAVESEEGAHFSGNLALGGPALWVNGEASVGQTVITADLISELADDFALLSGKVSAPLVRLPDIEILVDLLSVPETDAIDLEVDDEVKQALRADILFDVGKVTDGKDATGPGQRAPVLRGSPAAPGGPGARISRRLDQR